MRYCADISQLHISSTRNHAFRYHCHISQVLQFNFCYGATNLLYRQHANVPPEMTEAADMSGATKLQKLLKVELPLALPQQWRLVLTAHHVRVFHGDYSRTIELRLSQELQKTLVDRSRKKLPLVICVSLMALTFDMAIMSWSEKKKTSAWFKLNPRLLTE